MIREFRRQVPVLALIAGIVLMASSPSTAGASTASDLRQCNQLSQAVELTDGSLIGLGTTRDCGDTSSSPSPTRWQVLTGLDSSGRVDPGFGNGGFVLSSLADGEWIWKMVETTDGNLLVLTNRRVRSYSPGGSIRFEFGNNGQVTPISLDQINATPTDIVASEGGGFFLAGTHANRVRVGSYDAAGKLVPDFGSGGIVETGLWWAGVLALDSQSRILVADSDSLIRLLPDGSADGDFGGESGHAALNHWPVQGISVGEQGKITVISGGFDGWYGNPAYSRNFDPDGLPWPDNPGGVIGGDVNSATTYPGGIAIAFLPGRMMDARFSVGTTSEFPSRAYSLSPGTAIAAGVTPLSDGSILAVGFTDDSEICGFYCGDRRRMAMVKLNPATGEPEEDFGADGSRLIPANSCEYGSGGSVGDWQLCRVQAPVLSGSAKVTGRFSRRPSVLVKATLGDPPARLWGTRQNLVLGLPDGFGLRQGKTGLIEVESVPFRPATLSVEGRKVIVRVAPGFESWGGQYFGVEQKDSPLSIRVRFKRGSLKPIAGRSRKNPPPIRVRGTFIPTRGGMPGETSRAWFAPNSDSARINLGP